MHTVDDVMFPIIHTILAIKSHNVAHCSQQYRLLRNAPRSFPHPDRPKSHTSSMVERIPIYSVLFHLTCHSRTLNRAKAPKRQLYAVGGSCRIFRLLCATSPPGALKQHILGDKIAPHYPSRYVVHQFVGWGWIFNECCQMLVVLSRSLYLLLKLLPRSTFDLPMSNRTGWYFPGVDEMAVRLNAL